MTDKAIETVNQFLNTYGTRVLVAFFVIGGLAGLVTIRLYILATAPTDALGLYIMVSGSGVVAGGFAYLIAFMAWIIYSDNRRLRPLWRY